MDAASVSVSRAEVGVGQPIEAGGVFPRHVFKTPFLHDTQVAANAPTHVRARNVRSS